LQLAPLQLRRLEQVLIVCLELAHLISFCAAYDKMISK
jgi:hypothetical protein